MNENENTIHKNLGNTEKASSEDNFITVFKLLISLCYFVMVAQEN